MKKIFICGYYGFDNLGDEAILKSLVEGIRKEVPEAELTVLSASRHQTEEAYGVHAISRNDYRALMHAMKTQDILVFGGGSLLQDVTSSRSILYYLGLMALGKLHGKPIYMVAQGIGPIRKPVFRRMTRWIFRSARYISVRDRVSQSELNSMGISDEDVVVTTDPVWVLQAEPKRDRELTEKKTILMSLRPWGNPASMEAKWVELIKRLQEELSVQVELLSFHRGQDVPLAKRIAKRAGCDWIPHTDRAEEVLERIGSADLMIGVRLHSLIFSALVETPMIGISYDPKVDAFVDAMEAGPAYSVEGFSVDEIVKLAKSRMEDSDFQNRLRKKSRDLRAQAQQDQKKMIQELLHE